MRSLPVPDPGVPGRLTPWGHLRWLARVEPRALGAGIVFGILWMLSQALVPVALGRAVDDGIAARDTGALLGWSAVLLGLGAVQAASGILRHRRASFVWLAAAYRTAQVVTRQATRLGAALPRRISAGEVVSVGLTDVAHIGDGMDIMIRGSGAVVTIVVVSALLLGASLPLGLIVVIGVPLVLAAAAPLFRPYHRRTHVLRERVGELNTRAADIVAGLRVLRGIGGEQIFAERYRAGSQRVRRAGVRVAQVDSALSGAQILLPGLLIALVVWAGARAATTGAITPGELVTFYGYAVFLIHPMRTIGEAADKLIRAHVAAGRVVRLLALTPEPVLAGTTEPAGPGDLTDTESGLVVRPGRCTALVATDTAAARAIADRLGRYVDAGEVAYAGVPLRELADLRARILVAINEDRLFAGPLRAGLGDGPGVAAALHAACAEDIAEPDAHVAEAGREFSGGQQQRLRLARALAADPEVLILVEPTSAVDAHTEARIADRLRAARTGRTTLVCTTSPLMLDRADHVVFVSGGAVAAEGTHRELLRTTPGYAAVVTRGETLAPAD
ncbi:ABC transporter ATP-binding protein [Actinomadura craniellae]|uniref:ABC transporter ATP-binding protein n=1 Tax=Actinomadura craniellae TaxID=2231787 RepID=A0A365H5Q9_9ACTN|nr:ABC transporter ATP-binding protein [Actinomadura craniellae]RAY14444.1 ABC transporter ATP-binding protein [Actinomadura craniellae]